MNERHEMWLPTSTMTVTVIDGKVTIREDMKMEKKIVKKPAGFGKPDAPPDGQSYKTP